jgi:hypothetical protein
MKDATPAVPEHKQQSQPNPPNPLETIHITNPGLDVSGISDDSSRISLLENQFKTITSHFTVLLEQLAHQTTNNTENQKELFSMLEGIITQETSIAPPSVSTPDTTTTASSQSTTSALRVDSLPSTQQASSSTGTAGHGP